MGGLAPPGSIPGAAAAGQDGNFGGTLQALLLLSSLPQALFFSAKMATQDFTSPVAAKHLAAGAVFSAKMTARHFTSPVAANHLAAGAFCSRK